jgi:hypothetical protein
MAENSIMKLADKLESAQHKLKRAKEKGEVVATRAMRAVTTVAGGAAVGIMRGMWGDSAGDVHLPGTKIDADMALGVASVLAGVSEVAGKASDEVLAFGAGALAVVAARHLEQGVKDYEAKHK